MRSLSRSTDPRSSRRGSVLLVSLIFSAVIAISLGSFLLLASNATQLSYRTYYLGVGMNIAETGLEQALWSINRARSGDADAWDDWEDAPGSVVAKRRTFDLGSVAGGATAQVKVYARERIGLSAPMVIARAIVTPPRGAPIEKWIKVTLSRRSLFSVGGLGREGIRASGNNVYFASWNSDPDNDDTTMFVAYSDAVKNDNTSLATTELDAELNSGQADVNGKAAVGSDDLDDIKVGSQGYIGPFGTAAGTKDPNSVSTDFTADLTVPEPPADKTYEVIGAITGNTELPLPGATEQGGVYYYRTSQISLNNKTLSVTPGKKVVLVVDYLAGGSIKVGGGSGAIIAGGTLETDTSTGTDTYSPSELKIYTSGDVDIGGSGAANEITTQTFTPASTVTVYTRTYTTISNIVTLWGRGKDSGNITGWDYTQTIRTTTQTGSGPEVTTSSSSRNLTALLSRKDVEPKAGTTVTTTTTTTGTPASTVKTGTIPGQPKSFHLYGTRTAAEAARIGNQSIKISGNGSLSGVIYAPYADIEAKGGGNSGFIYGSLVGASLTFTGNDCFYYDESLANLDDDGRYGIDNWAELVSYANRDTYKSVMNF